MKIWDPHEQCCTLVTNGLSPEMSEAITNMLQLYSMCVTCSPRMSRYIMRFQRHAGSFYYVLVEDGNSSSLVPWLQAAQEVEAMYGHKPAISG